MGAAYRVEPEAMTGQQSLEVLFDRAQTAPKSPSPSLTAAVDPQPAALGVADGDVTPLPKKVALQRVLEQADIDISGPEFNFVRSIRVFHARFVRQWEAAADGDCNRMASVRMGSYGTQGDFSWSGSSIDALPRAHVGTEDYGDDCLSLWHRSVFVEWRDYEGKYGYEQVNY